MFYSFEEVPAEGGLDSMILQALFQVFSQESYPGERGGGGTRLGLDEGSYSKGVLFVQVFPGPVVGCGRRKQILLS